MSAFICGPDHFKVLAIFGASRTGGYGNSHARVDPRYVKGMEYLAGSSGTEIANAYADVLYQENIRSVLDRYPQDTFESAPGLIEKPKRIVITGRDETMAKFRLAPVAVLKMCDGLEYQSCETDDYRQTVAFDLLDRIRGAAIKALPGYDDAPWDYDADEVKAA